MSKKIKDKSLLIIDGYGFVFRAYHVQPPLTSPSGAPVGAIYGFTSMLLKVINDFKPEYAVVVLDSKGKNFRHDLFKEYKAHRPPAPEDLISQLAIVEEAASALNFLVVAKEGFEADDIIATMAVQCTNDEQEAVIISSDKDLLQLMNSKVRVYDPVKSKFISEEDVLLKFGVLPNKVREVQALMGDSSDNIPGVKGIGPKTAAELINNFNTLEGIYAAIEQIKSPRQRELLSTYRDAAFLSWQLVGLALDVEIPKELNNFVWKAPSAEKITAFLTKHGFRSLHKRVENLFDVKVGLAIEEGVHNADFKMQSHLNTSKIAVNSSASLNELITKIEKYGVVGVSFDSEGSDIEVAVSVDGNTYLLNYQRAEQLSETDLFTYAKKEDAVKHDNEFIEQLFADASVKKLVIDLKKFYKKFPADLNSFEDLSLMDYCLSSGIKAKSAIQMVAYYTQTEIDDEISLLDLTPYFIHCYENLKAELFAQKTLHLYETIDLKLCRILHLMEEEGIKIDVPYLRLLSAEFQQNLQVLEKEIFAICGEEFNIASAKQLGQILFEKLKLPFSKISDKSKSYNTSAEILEKLSEGGYAIADLLLKYRHLSKLKNTYTDTLPKLATLKDHRIHTTFLQSSTTTGRLSSQDPNVQNIPVRSEEGNNIRAAFIASKGYKLLSADYSQIELRILSHVANVGALKEAFIKGEDIHKQTASQIFGLPMHEVSSELRRSAKAINFGIIYGISAFGLAKNLNITKKAAADYIEKYFKEYPGIEKYMQDTISFARKNLYVENLFGRRCYVPMINNKNHALKSFAERAAINAPMQSLTADIAKMAMISVDKELKDRNFKTKMLLQIHDELVFEVPIEELEQVAQLIRSLMESVIKLDIPIKVDVSFGDNWKEL